MNPTDMLDFLVRRQIYDHAMGQGYPPSIAELCAYLSIPPEDTLAAVQRLAAGRILVLQPGSNEILMANPFSAVPTPFVVNLPAYSCFGNCIWDAMGIVAMLKQDALIKTACGDCGMALELRITGDRLEGDDSIIHFAIPAHSWWDDIVFN